jgi:transcriptional antiterminator RfaH
MIDTLVSERITERAVVMSSLHPVEANRLSRGNMFWYAVKCKPHQERLAEIHLKRAGIVTLFPQIKEPKIVRRRRQVCINALFPGYLFAQFNVEPDYRTVIYCRGVRDVVSFGPNPAVVEEEMIQAIKDRLCNGYVTIRDAAFTPGQVVRIQEGPLRGIEAVFEMQLPGYQRAVLLLRAISYQAKVVVDLKDIVNF